MDSDRFNPLLHSGMNLSSYDTRKGYHVNLCQPINHLSDVNMNYIADQYRFSYNINDHQPAFDSESAQMEKFGYFKESNLPEETKSDWSKSCEETAERGESSPHIMRKRPRTTFSQSQLLELEKEFIHTAYLDRANRISLAGKLNLKEKQIKVWFQNRRMKRKRDESEQKRRRTLSDNITESTLTMNDRNQFHMPFTSQIGRNSINCVDPNSTNISCNFEPPFPRYGFDHVTRSPLLNPDYINHSGINFESFISHYNHLYEFPNSFEPQLPCQIEHSSFIPYESPSHNSMVNYNQAFPVNFCSDLPYDDIPNYHNCYQNNYFD